MNKREAKFWRREMEILDGLYRERMKQWQRLIDIYDLRFNTQIRDLRKEDLVKVSRFYPLVRQIIASIAFNYPKMFFEVEDDETGEVATILERATSSLFNLTDTKSHVHQAIFDALFCSVGWLRIDYNPPGDDKIPPYVSNDAMTEDLCAVSRVPPGWVHLDPMCPPHKLGHARYIRERMLVPLKFLKDDPDVKNKGLIKPSMAARVEEFGYGDPGTARDETPEMKATRESVENDDIVLVDRIHDRINRKLIMFAEGVEEPIQEIDHPFIKMSFPQKMDLWGELMFEEDGVTPVLDMAEGQPSPGWLVENGFPFVPVKFDLHATSFYPQPHLQYVEDIQHGIVESLSRQASLLKRTSRQGVVAEQEVLNKPELLEDLRKGVDGEWHSVQDVNNFKELNYGDVPPDQVRLEDRLRGYEEEITRVTDLAESAGTPRTATEASLIATQMSVNREWMEAAVSRVYETVARNFLQIHGDPRYTPENFIVNVAPDGQQALTRAMRSADFLWNYKIRVVAGSTQPLFEQIQQDKFLQFYDRAAQRPSFDQMELDKMLASSAEVDVDKVMLTSENPEAIRAAQLENDRMISQFQDPGILPQQDHKAHLSAHADYKNHPTYQQFMQQAQQAGFNGQPLYPEAVQRAQAIDQLMAGHMQQHQAAQSEQVQGPSTGGTGRPAPRDSIQSTVRGNAQRVANTMATDAEQTVDGA